MADEILISTLECISEDTGKTFAFIDGTRTRVEIDWETVTQIALDVQSGPLDRRVEIAEAIALLLYLVKNQHQN